MSSMATNEVTRGGTKNLVGATGNLEAGCGCRAVLRVKLLDGVQQRRVVEYTLTQGNCAQGKCKHGAAMVRVSYRSSQLDSGQEFTSVLEARLPLCHMPDVKETRAHAKLYCYNLTAVA